MKENDMRNLAFWLIIATIYGILFSLEYFVWGDSMIAIGKKEHNLGKIIFYIHAIYTIASLRIVWATELGARLLFGKPINTLSSGLTFIPLGICQISKETKLTIEDELPADPEHIFRVKMGDPEVVPLELVREGYVPPIRITFNYPEKKSESDDPLNSRITAEVVVVIRWRIRDYVQFLGVIGSRREARRQLQDVSVNTIFPILTKLTAAQALTELESVNKTLEEKLRKMLGGEGPEDRPWGAQLANAQIKLISFSHDLNDKIENVAKAKLEKKAIILKAEGEKKKRQLEGVGAGFAEKAVLKGRTEGLLAMAQKLNVSSQSVLGAETARAITENPGQKTIIPGSSGFGDLVAVASVVGETLKEERK